MSRDVQILRRQQVFKKAIFRIDEAVLQHTRFDGSMSEPMTRLVLERGDSVAVLLHDVAADEIILTEQFRFPTHERGPGWIREIPAGMVEPGENEEDCVRREAMEEIGFAVGELRRIALVYLSPGGSSERVHIFYAATSLTEQVAKGGGVACEGEDIQLIRVAASDAIQWASDGRIDDAKTLIAVQWLALHSSALRKG